jgi:hypothetical protein
MTTRQKEEISYKKVGAGEYKILLKGVMHGLVRKTSSGKLGWEHSSIAGFWATRKEAAEAAIAEQEAKRNAEMAEAEEKRAEREALDSNKIEAIRTGDWEENAINWLSQLSIPGIKSDIGWEVSGINQEHHLIACIEKEGVKIKMDIEPAMESRNFSSTFDICGHVDFEVDGSWFTFDRRGISDSFYCQDEPGFFYTIDDIVTEQLNKIQESIERRRRSVAVPSLPYTVTPELKSIVAEKLKAGQSYLFAPAGMGTAHQLSTQNSPYSQLGSAELAEFFGVERIFITTQDWD